MQRWNVTFEFKDFAVITWEVFASTSFTAFVNARAEMMRMKTWHKRYDTTLVRVSFLRLDAKEHAA